MKNAQDNLEQELKRELARVENLGRLVELQDRLLINGELEQLPRVLERKGRIIAHLLEAGQRFESRANTDSGLSGQTAGLWSELKERVRKYAAADKASLERAVEIRQNLARKLRQIKTGKKMLLGYSPQTAEGKSRFKDIKT